MASWLRSDLSPLLTETLLGDGGVCRELFVPAALERLIQEHRDGVRDRTRELFSLLSLGMWHQAIVHGP